MDSFEEILQKKHLKRTKARVMILKVLQKSLPMTAGDVYEAVRKRDTKLSLSTGKAERIRCVFYSVRN